MMSTPISPEVIGKANALITRKGAAGANCWYVAAPPPERWTVDTDGRTFAL